MHEMGRTLLHNRTFTALVDHSWIYPHESLHGESGLDTSCAVLVDHGRTYPHESLHGESGLVTSRGTFEMACKVELKHIWGLQMGCQDWGQG